MDRNERRVEDPEWPSAPAAGNMAGAIPSAWFDLLLETSPIAMGVISALENRYLRVNRRMADLVGMTVDELLACDPYRLALETAHPDELVAEQKLFAELAVGARTSYQIEKRFVRRDGSIRWGLLTFSGIHESSPDPGSPVRPLRFAISQVVDITEKKAAFETLRRREGELRHAQKVDGIGRLAAGIAHDFNNLLTVMMGYGEVLKKGLTRDNPRPAPVSELTENVDAILAACDRAAGLTAQVLAYGRRETVAPCIFVLSEAAEDWQRFLGRAIGSHVQVEQSLAGQGAIFADRGQVGQVIMNLILNARDAIREDGRILLATRDLVVDEDAGHPGPPPGPGAWVALAISDDGHGMSPAVRDRMFEPFFTTRTDRPGTHGTGLGLSTVQRIVEEAGGSIDVESAPGRGTTVTAFFPRVAMPPVKFVGPDVPPRPAPAPNSLRVLVVEDEPAVRSLVASVLLGAHYRVAVARDGEEALTLLASVQEPFDLIVTDLAMPGIGGMTLAHRLHEHGSSRHRMLFISGHSHHMPAELATFGRLLAKPFTPAELLEAVLETMEAPV
jgi:two-component system cell cycle sensor histidine kinase/response regulator CckA